MPDEGLERAARSRRVLCNALKSRVWLASILLSSFRHPAVPQSWRKLVAQFKRRSKLFLTRHSCKRQLLLPGASGYSCSELDGLLLLPAAEAP